MQIRSYKFSFRFTYRTVELSHVNFQSIAFKKEKKKGEREGEGEEKEIREEERGEGWIRRVTFPVSVNVDPSHFHPGVRRGEGDKRENGGHGAPWRYDAWRE